MKRRFDPIDRDIVRALAPLRRPVTPTKVARTIGIHPATAKSRIENMWKKDKILNCKYKGNRLMCKVNREQMNKTKFFG